MVARRSGNISAEATTKSGNIFNEAMRGASLRPAFGSVGDDETGAELVRDSNAKNASGLGTVIRAIRQILNERIRQLATRFGGYSTQHDGSKVRVLPGLIGNVPAYRFVGSGRDRRLSKTWHKGS
jgi:hypothetical protein